MTSPAESIEVTCTTELSAFEDLKDAWRQLSSRSADMSVFQTYEWLSTWWKHYGTGSPYLLLARLNSELVAILPLYRSTKPLPLARALKIIRPVGIGGDTSPDYLGQIAVSEYAKQTAEAFITYLFRQRRDWDVLELTDLSNTSPLLERLRATPPPAGCFVETPDPIRIHFTALPRTWDDYLGALTAHARYEVRNKKRKFLSLPGSRLFQWADATRLDTAIDDLIRLHTQRWHDRSDRHSFSTTKYKAFHRDLMHAFMERQWLRLYCAELDGALIGIFYGYSFGGTLYHFQGGFDPRYVKLSVGQCVMSFAIENAIQEGCRELDLLRGDYDYKKRWASDVRQTFTHRVFRRTPSHSVNHVLERYVAPIRTRSMRLVRQLIGRRPSAHSPSSNSDA